MSSSIQVIRDTAQGLVNYVANQMHRPDVASNLQEWHYAMISKHLDIISNDLRSKQKQIETLKNNQNEVEKLKKQLELLQDKLEQKNQQQNNTNKNLNSRIYQLEDNCSKQKLQIKEQTNSLDEICKNLCSRHGSSYSNRQKVNDALKMIDWLRKQKQVLKRQSQNQKTDHHKYEQKYKEQLKKNNTLNEKLKKIQKQREQQKTQREKLKAQKHELKSQQDQIREKYIKLKHKLQKLQTKVKNEKQGINPITISSIFDDGN